MPEAPVVTIIDPHGGSLVGVEPGGPPPLSRRLWAGWRSEGLLLLAIVVLVVAGVARVQDLHHDRSRREAAARAAKLDVVRLHVTGVRASTLAAGSAQVTITAMISTPDPALKLTQAYVMASGYVQDLEPETTPDLTNGTAQVAGLLKLNCASVRLGRLPGDILLVLTVVPASGNSHQIRQAVPASVVAASVSLACRPAAVPGGSPPPGTTTGTGTGGGS